MGNRTYVVHRRAYTTYGAAVGQNEGSDSISLVPIRAFADHAVAQSYVAELMRVARRTVNPFVAYDYPDIARVRALKIQFRVNPNFKWGEVEWQRWYDGEASHLTDDEREKVWSLFDARPLFGIREVPLGDG